MGAVSLLTNLLDLSMTSALQRVVPTRDSESEAHGAVKFALIVALLLGVAAAILVSLEADRVARLFSAAPADAAPACRRHRLVRLGAASVDLHRGLDLGGARRGAPSGPRSGCASSGSSSPGSSSRACSSPPASRGLGLMLAHLSSLALTALLCVPLLRRFYDLRLLLRAPVPRKLAGELLGSGFALLPANLRGGCSSTRRRWRST